MFLFVFMSLITFNFKRSKLIFLDIVSNFLSIYFIYFSFFSPQIDYYLIIHIFLFFYLLYLHNFFLYINLRE